MFTKTTIAAMLALFMSVAASAAADVKVGALQIAAPWARATPKGAAIGGGYLKITNSGAASDRLIGGSTAIASRLEVHEMSMSDGTMKMRHLASGVEIKPGESVELKPGGIHLMFVQLKEQLKQGQHLTATLEFEKAGKVDVGFDVAGIGATQGGAASGHQGH